MENETPVIVKTVHELLSTYDVTDKHLCINERGNPLQEVLGKVRGRLEKEHPELLEGSDYFGIYTSVHSEIQTFPTDYWGVLIFYVKGGSEGYYVHVEVRKDGKSTLLFLGKTLLEGEAGRAWAEKMVCALSRIIEV